MSVINPSFNYYDFAKTCRVCLNNENKMENIFSSLSLILKSLSFLEVEVNDGLPEIICESCAASVRSAYALKQLCKRSEDILKRALEENNTKIINEDILIDSYKLQPNIDVCNESDESWGNFDENLYHNEDDTRKIDNEQTECYLNIDQNVDYNTTGGVERDSQMPQAIYCEICGYKLEHINEKEAHMKSCHNVVHKCAKCEMSFTDPKVLRKHYKSNCSKNFICEFCGKTFCWKCDLLIHIRIHTGEKPLKCEMCDKSFSNPKAYKTHKRIHTGEKPYECKTCNKTFSHSSVLKIHKRIHTSERPYVCSYCYKTFVYRANLTIHLRSHTGERPYNCDICKKSFSSSSTLSAHRKTHSGEKRFICSICGKKLARSGDLTVHMRTHTGEKPYKCDVCQKQFRISSHLIEHMRSHTGEKNYECKFCGKAFTQPRTLRFHMQMHTGTRPYTCDVCCKSFTYSSSLHSHKKKHHVKHTDQSQEKSNCPTLPKDNFSVEI